jgi:hypothetical protein
MSQFIGPMISGRPSTLPEIPNSRCGFRSHHGSISITPKFHPFQRLPPELRLEIWGYNLPEQVIQLTQSMEYHDFSTVISVISYCQITSAWFPVGKVCSQHKVSSLYSVNTESRAVVKMYERARIPIFASLNANAVPIYLDPLRDSFRLWVSDWAWAEKLPPEAQEELKLVQKLIVLPRDFTLLGLQRRLERFNGLRKLIVREDAWFVMDAKAGFEEVFRKWWFDHMASKRRESAKGGGETSKAASVDVIVAKVDYVSSFEGLRLH